MLRRDAHAVVLDRQAQRLVHLPEAHHNRRLPLLRRRHGIPDEVREHLVEGVGLALQEHPAHADDPLERDPPLAGERPLQCHARTHDLRGVEPLGAGQPAPGPVLDGAQECDRLVHALPHPAELLEQLRAERGLERAGFPHQLERQIEARERGGEGVGHFVGDDAGLADQLGEGVRLRDARARGRSGGGLIDESHAETRQLQDDPLAAASLDPVGRRCGRLPAHRGDAPGLARVQLTADPPAPLDDRGTPPVQRAVEVEPGALAFRAGGAGHDGDHFRARRHFPEGDDSSLECYTRLAQDLHRPRLHADQDASARRSVLGCFCGTKGRECDSRRRQLSPFRRPVTSLSGSARRLAATTRLRPPLFAWYMAASALAISSSGVSPCVGYSATPTLTLSFRAPKASAATRARMRSPTEAAVVTGASISIKTNSSPPYRATLSTPRVVLRRISAIFTSAASPARWPCVSLYCLK